MAKTTGRDRRPYVKRVERVELAENVSRWRVIAFVVALLVGIGALVYGVMTLFSSGSGWQRIQSSTSDGQTCASEFVFNYHLGRSGAASAIEARQLTALYTELTEKAYRIFDEQQPHVGYANVYYVNQYPNQEVRIAPWLYQAFEKVAASGSRMLYLAPIYDEYRNVFLSESDAEAINYDPYLNPDKAAEFLEICGFVNDPDHVQLELLGNDTVCLRVSDAYLAYAEENGISRYVDFFAAKNAFVIDLLADSLIEAGYPHGSLTSCDGFTRNCDPLGETYSYTLLNETDARVYQAGSMQYDKPMALVMLRRFALGDMEALHYYRAADGSMRVPFISEADGLCRSAAASLVGYSNQLGCAQLYLLLHDVYTADTLDTGALQALTAKGVQSIWFEGELLKTTDPALQLVSEPLQ